MTNISARSMLAPFALGLLALSCGPSAGPAGPPTHAIYQMQDVQKSWQADPADSTKEVWVSFHYPQFTAAPGAAAVDSLNEWVRLRLLRSAPADTMPASLDALAASLIADYRTFRERNPSSRLVGWFFEGEIAVTWDSLGVVTLDAVSDGYTGGAHGFSARTLAMFDATTGRRLGIADLVRPDALEALAGLAESEFRGVRRLAPDAKLDQEGFWFEGGRFRLNDNAGLGAHGLTFYYNDYEIAPHSMGPTEVRIEWAELRPLLRADGPLGAFARGKV